MENLIENWLNGNLKDVVDALINGKKSDAILFALELQREAPRNLDLLIAMLRNRNS